eukprot:1158699-Pelagomonas_calceolata.AAC.14
MVHPRSPPALLLEGHGLLICLQMGCNSGLVLSELNEEMLDSTLKIMDCPSNNKLGCNSEMLLPLSLMQEQGCCAGKEAKAMQPRTTKIKGGLKAFSTLDTFKCLQSRHLQKSALAHTKKRHIEL